VDVSAEIELPELSDIQTRKEFNRITQHLSSFTNKNNQRYQFRKNEHGVVASKAEINKITRENKRARRLADQETKKIENLPFVSRGKKTEMTAGERRKMLRYPTTAGISKPEVFDFSKIQSQHELDYVKRKNEAKSTPVFYDEKLIQFKKNWIAMMEQGFHGEEDDIVDKLKSLPPDVFYEIYQMFDEFDFRYYDSENQGGINDKNRGNLEIIEGYLNDYFLGNLNLDLKEVGKRKQ
jgi:hypothetical protein